MPILLLLVILGLTSCESTEEKKLKELIQEVESLHDVLMIKSEDLVKLRRNLVKSTNGSANQEKRMEIREHVGLINAGESFMNDWMKMYHTPDESEPIAEKIKYYDYQLKELQRMEKHFVDAEKRAKQYIKQYGE